MSNYHGDYLEDNTADSVTTGGTEDYYPEGKIYYHFAKQVSAPHLEDIYWHENLVTAIVILTEEKLGSPRIKKLGALWYSGFEDRELKKLERSLLTIRILADDILRENKELKLWKLQNRHLKDLLCQVDDIVDDFALRAAQLKQLFQSRMVRHHPYLTDKLGQLNNLIQELDTIAAEIKSVVLPEFYSARSRKLPNPTFHGNQQKSTSSQAPIHSDDSSIMENLVLHFGALTTSLSRMENRQIRMERKQETIAEDMRSMYDSLSRFSQISGHNLPPSKDFDSSDSE